MDAPALDQAFRGSWSRRSATWACAGITALALAAGCSSPVPIERTAVTPSAYRLSAAPADSRDLELARRGDEIVIAGRYFHTDAPVVLWTDRGGYDAYRVQKRFVPFEKAEWDPKAPSPELPNRYGLRFERSPNSFTPEQLEQVRGGGWDLELLREKVDQFVVHYDVAGTSRQCFRVLHDLRGLSVHFLLDVDGTIYQTLDVKERAWHATSSNDRSVGIEIANIGAYAPGRDGTLDKWYARDERGRTVLTLASSMGDGGVRTPGPFYPAQPDKVVGTIQGRELAMYDLTPQQYDSLAKLTATLCTVLPRIRCDYPRDARGNLLLEKLPEGELATYEGLLGHYHIQLNKADPGPAFQWDKVVGEAREIMKSRSSSR